MSQLIVHVGPPKCGSSSIQNFLEKEPCEENVCYIKISSKKVDSFILSDFKSNQFSEFIERVNHELNNKKVIISQEYLFGNTTCIEAICNAVNTKDIKLIGYSRRQSSYLISAFSQWEFRSHSSYKFHTAVLNNHSINPLFFTGLEGFLISVILSDFKSSLSDPRYRIYDWNSSYQQLEQSVPDYGVVVNCLPSKSYSYNLIQDFCTQSNLSIKVKKRILSRKKDNIKFDSTLTESIHCALTNDLEIPDEHSYNYKLNSLSKKLGMSNYPQGKFLQHLSDYIDTHFFSSNRTFCRRYSIPIEEFQPSQKISKKQIHNIIFKELIRRQKNPEELLSYYKKLLGKWGQFSYNNILIPKKKNIVERILRKTNII